MHTTLIVNLKILPRSLWPHVFTIFIFYGDGDTRMCVWFSHFRSALVSTSHRGIRKHIRPPLPHDSIVVLWEVQGTEKQQPNCGSFAYSFPLNILCNNTQDENERRKI